MAHDNDNKEGQPEELPPFYLHETETFNTLYIGKAPDHLEPSKNDARKVISNLVSLLTDPRNSAMRHDVLVAVKNAGTPDALLAALKLDEYKEHRTNLTAACWECGLDFSDYLDDFVTLAIEGNYETTLEAMTVIQEMQGTFERPDIDAAVQKLEKALPSAVENSALLTELLAIVNKLPLTA